MKKTQDYIDEFREFFARYDLPEKIMKFLENFLRVALSSQKREIVSMIESKRKWADEATREQENNIRTYNEAVDDIIASLK